LERLYQQDLAQKKKNDDLLLETTMVRRSR
jgi:hypothetical protein